MPEASCWFWSRGRAHNRERSFRYAIVGGSSEHDSLQDHGRMIGDSSAGQTLRAGHGNDIGSHQLLEARKGNNDTQVARSHGDTLSAGGTTLYSGTGGTEMTR